LANVRVMLSREIVNAMKIVCAMSLVSYCIEVKSLLGYLAEDYYITKDCMD